MNLVKSLGVISALLLLAACENPGGVNGSGNGAGGTGGYGANGVNAGPGTQGDLEANVGDRVFFDYDSSVINGEGESTLARQAEWLKKYPDVKVTVEGHCDERGTREYNLALGERRANSVKKYLAGLGISSSRITTISYGKERPATSGSDDSTWSQNRRGVTVVSQ